MQHSVIGSTLCNAAENLFNFIHKQDDWRNALYGGQSHRAIGFRFPEPFSQHGIQVQLEQRHRSLSIAEQLRRLLCKVGFLQPGKPTNSMPFGAFAFCRLAACG